jgi:hypothetical protein
MDTARVVTGVVTINGWFFWDGVTEFAAGKFAGNTGDNVFGNAVGVAGHCVGRVVVGGRRVGVVGCVNIINWVNGCVGMVGGFALGCGSDAFGAVALVRGGTGRFWVIVSAKGNAGSVVGVVADVADATLSTGKTR